MKKSFLIALTLFIFLDALFVMGWFGMIVTPPIKLADCDIHYPRYLIQPFIKKLLLCGGKDCDAITPFGKAEADTQVIQCLCQKPEQNKDGILNFYKQNFSAESQPSTVESICQ